MIITVDEDKLTSSLCALTKADNTTDSVLLTAETASSSDEELCDTRMVRRLKLNAFLEECRVMPLSRTPMLPWEEASERTRERYCGTHIGHNNCSLKFSIRWESTQPRSFLKNPT